MKCCKIHLLFIALLSFYTAAVGQKIIIGGEETSRKLKWSDFSGKVDRSSPFVANTFYKSKTKVGKVIETGDSSYTREFEVILELDPDKSWAKKDGITDDLLIHEQGHFNIGILCMREVLSIYKSTKFTKTNFNDKLQQIVSETSKKYHEMGIKYDEETDHSKNREQQLKWDTFFLEKLGE